MLRCTRPDAHTPLQLHTPKQVKVNRMIKTAREGDKCLVFHSTILPLLLFILSQILSLLVSSRPYGLRSLQTSSISIIDKHRLNTSLFHGFDTQPMPSSHPHPPCSRENNPDSSLPHLCIIPHSPSSIVILSLMSV